LSILSLFLLHAASTTQVSTLSLHDALPISRSASSDAARSPRSGGRSNRSSPTRSPASSPHGTASPPSGAVPTPSAGMPCHAGRRSEEHTSELQSRENLVCRLLLEKKTK